MTLNDLIKELQAIKKECGGDLPVTYLDGDPTFLARILGASVVEAHEINADSHDESIDLDEKVVRLEIY